MFVRMVRVRARVCPRKRKVEDLCVWGSDLSNPGILSDFGLS